MKDQPPPKPTRQRILLTTLGIKPKSTKYSIDGSRTAEGKHAPLALWKLLSPAEKPDKVMALVTPQAKETSWPDFHRACEALETRAFDLAIPHAASTGDISKTLELIAEEIPDGTDLILDLTHGYRHLPFMLYALTLYLTASRDVRIDSAWYGMLEGTAGSSDARPLIWLKPLLDLPEWFYAVRIFADTGVTAQLSHRFRALKEALPKGPDRGPPRKAAHALEGFAEAYENGMPLELGLAAGKLAHTIEEQPLSKLVDHDLPLAGELGRSILESVKSIRFPGHTGLANGNSKGEWKPEVVLDKQELLRQVAIIDLYLGRDQLSQAIGLMREWVVSLGVFHRGLANDWLGREARHGVERELGTLVELARRNHLGEEQKDWADFWGKLRTARNSLAHHGMSQNAFSKNSALRGIPGFWTVSYTHLT